VQWTKIADTVVARLGLTVTAPFFVLFLMAGANQALPLDLDKTLERQV
jgi:antitoxin component of RelBE/YafQ-DinJ toxin-antitoxin module